MRGEVVVLSILGAAVVVTIIVVIAHKSRTQEQTPPQTAQRALTVAEKVFCVMRSPSDTATTMKGAPFCNGTYQTRDGVKRLQNSSTTVLGEGLVVGDDIHSVSCTVVGDTTRYLLTGIFVFGNRAGPDKKARVGYTRPESFALTFDGGSLPCPASLEIPLFR